MTNHFFLALITSALLVSAATASRASDCDLWVEHSAVKVLRDAARPAKASSSARLNAARREWESFQIALRSGAPIRGIEVEASDLRQVKGDGMIPADNVDLKLVAYVPIKTPAVPYPDPLPPLRPFDLKADETQPVFATIKVPADCPPGEYKGSLTVSGVGMKARKVPVSLRVWGFALPVTSRCATAFGIWMQYVGPQHGLKEGDPKLDELHKKYYEFLLDHKISAYNIPVNLKSPEAKAYLEDPRMTSYVIPYSADDAELKETVRRLIENDWFRKGYFYPIDEPFTRESYDQMLAMTKRLRSIEPNYRIVVPYFRGPDWDESKTIYDYALGEINIWCPNEHYLDLQERTRPWLRDRRNAGDDVWWYVCCGPGSPYSNFFVEMPAAAHRTLFWHQKRENIDGLLYWATTYWNPDTGCADPWKTMVTVSNINPDIHGDGSLLYPGKAVGVDGPVSSLRLEVIRDGIEDFDLLCLADETLGKDATRGFIRGIAKSLTEYETDPWTIERARVQLGDAIEAKLRD